MKKVVTAAAICSMAASASATSFPSKLQVPSVVVLQTRGGAAAPPNSTSVPKTTGASSNSSTKKKKSTKRKPKTTTADNNVNKDESTTKQENASSAQQEEEEKQTDPFLEDLINQEDYYIILGVSKTATDSQIKKAYRKRAVQTHPDKTGGDRRAFDKVSEAYSILSDETKRQVYSRFGKRGLEQQKAGGNPAGGGRGAEDMFRQFFGQAAQRQQHAPRNRTVRYQLEVSLEDLYQGMTRSILVEQPHGRKKVQVHIPKGTSSGESIVLSGEMDEYADVTPGDLIFLLQQRPHTTFTRKGHDLAMELSVSLQEAIGGMEREITHLDGRKIVLKSARRIEETAVWIQTGDVHVLKGEGMPKSDSTSNFGDLYVQFRVVMPKASSADRLSVEEREQLGHLLDKLEGKHSTKFSDDATVRLMEKAKLADFGSASGTFRRQQEEQQEDQGGSQRSFFYTGGAGGGSHPFFGGSPMGGNDDGSNVQCQQM
jgi:DnaJ-class molecular chaperone